MSSITVVDIVLRIFNLNSWLARVICPSCRVSAKVDCFLPQSRVLMWSGRKAIW